MYKADHFNLKPKKLYDDDERSYKNKFWQIYSDSEYRVGKTGQGLTTVTGKIEYLQSVNWGSIFYFSGFTTPFIIIDVNSNYKESLSKIHSAINSNASVNILVLAVNSSDIETKSECFCCGISNK